MHPIVFAIVSVFMISLAGGASAQPWQSTDLATAGWSSDGLKAAQDYAASLKPTAVMVVQDGKVIASWGDVSRKVNVTSVRKSLLSALYGIAVAERRIDLTSSLADLGIDDKRPALTAIEKQATIRDLLMARSGVYHVAAYETADIRQKRPKRGSHAPGTFWFYNNWEFNALGTIYRQQTGEDIFQSFAKRIAAPVGMQDFSARDGSYSLEKSSIHPAYPFTMSALDLGRFGQLFLNGGKWDGQQVIPAAWVQESTMALSQPSDHNSGYGYMWWTLRTDQWGQGGAFNAGYGGQVVAYVPEKQLVIVQTVDPAQNRCGITSTVKKAGWLPFGVSEMDAALPGGGLAHGALHEFAGGGSWTVDSAAAAHFAAGIAAGTKGPIIWCLTCPEAWHQIVRIHAA